MELWEILVPAKKNDGSEYNLSYHQLWDQQVRDITGGLTIMKPAKGQWVNPEDKEVFIEAMIPVRIAIENNDQLEKIINLTMQHYQDQIAVMVYRISDNTIIRYREELKK